MDNNFTGLTLSGCITQMENNAVHLHFSHFLTQCQLCDNGVESCYALLWIPKYIVIETETEIYDLSHCLSFLLGSILPKTGALAATGQCAWHQLRVQQDVYRR